MGGVVTSDCKTDDDDTDTVIAKKNSSKPSLPPEPYSNLYIFESFSKKNGRIYAAGICNDYVAKEKNELTVRDRETVYVENVDNVLGWVLCRKVGTETGENWDQVGYVPMDHFSNKQWKHFNSIVMTTETIKYKCKEGRLFLNCYQYKDREDDYYKGATYPLGDSHGSFLFPSSVKPFSFPVVNVKKKTERAQRAQDLIAKIPYRVIVDEIIGPHVWFKVNGYSDRMSQFFGRFKKDRMRKVFCVFRSLSICWSSFDKDIKLIPAKFLRSIRFFYWSDGGHVPCGSDRQRRPLPLSLWSKCVNLSFISEVVTYDHSSANRENIDISFLANLTKLKVIGTIEVVRMTRELVAQVSKVKSLTRLQLYPCNPTKAQEFVGNLYDLELPNLLILSCPYDGSRFTYSLLPNLTELESRQFIFSRTVVDGLCVLKRLKRLSLTYILSFEKGCDFFRILQPPLLTYVYLTTDKCVFPKEEADKLDLVILSSKIESLSLSSFKMDVPKSFLLKLLSLKKLKYFSISNTGSVESIASVLTKNQKIGCELKASLAEKEIDEEIIERVKESAKDCKNVKLSIRKGW